ncbi:MAG: hypothetical protein ABIJ65_11105, partial [Chloroflexota bacterium]
MKTSNRFFPKAGKIMYILSVAMLIASLLINMMPPSPAFAHHPILSGVVSCEIDGSQKVTWTIANSRSQKKMEIKKINRVLVGAVEGKILDISVSIQGVEYLPKTQTGTITLTVTGNWVDGNVTDTSSASVNLGGNCPIRGLSLAKTGALDLGDGKLDVCDLISYSLLVTNIGNITLSNVAVSDPLLSSVSCPGGNPIPSMAPTASLTCSGSYTITQADIDAGNRHNTATASNGRVSATDSYNVPLNPTAKLSIAKTGVLDLGDGKLDVGDLISYSLLVTNIGNITLSNVAVSDPLLASVSCPGGNPIPSMAPAASLTCSGSYAITQADIDAGNRYNTATASNGQVSATDSYNVPLNPTAKLSITKTGV